MLRWMSGSFLKPPTLMVVFACAFLVGMSEYRAGVDGVERGFVGPVSYELALASAYTVAHGELSLLPAPRTTREQQHLLRSLGPAGKPLALRGYDDFLNEAKLKPLSVPTDLTYKEVIHASNLGFWSPLPIRFAKAESGLVVTDAGSPAMPDESNEADIVTAEAADALVEMGPPAPERIETDATPASAAGADEEILTVFVGPPAPADLSATAPEERRRLPFDPLRVGPFTDIEPARPDAEEFGPSEREYHTVPEYYDIVHRIRPNQTVSDVLDEQGVSPQEADQWITAARKAYNLHRVYVGQKLSLTMHGPTDKIAKLVLEISGGTNLVVDKRDGRLVSRREDIEMTRNVRVVSGTIKSSLYMAAVAKGVPDKIVSEIAEILGWEINFSRDLRPGAGFKITYEELSREGSDKVSAGRVLSVQLANRGKMHEGFYYTDEKAAIKGYFNRKGDGLGRFFLRYPVSFSRISSHFSNKRFHPVLKRSRPHYGVDFAASTGTPVKAVADGKVVKAGWHGGNGRFVKIRHGKTYETGYAHLSRIAASTKLGGWVKKGQVIGYVGSSGLATGPHLHFAMYKNGKYIDPLKANLPRTESLTGAHLMAHKLTISATDEAYARAEADPAGSILLASLPKL